MFPTGAATARLSAYLTSWSGNNYIARVGTLPANGLRRTLLRRGNDYACVEVKYVAS